MRTVSKIAAVAALSTVAIAGPAAAYESDTTVPGQFGRDGVVTGHYTLDNDPTDWDGDKVADTTCDYVVNYRGDFGGNPRLDNGWIFNQYVCEDGSQGTYLIVHKSDKRFTDNSERAIWGTWEIVNETVKGTGNIANPQAPMYAYGA
jgi:hypothetical protein